MFQMDDLNRSGDDTRPVKHGQMIEREKCSNNQVPEKSAGIRR